MTPIEKKIGDYVMRHPDEVLGSSALQIAEATGTSDASVIRTVKGLGYAGLRELKKELLENVLRRRSMAATLDHNIDRILTNERPVAQMLKDSVDVLTAFVGDFDHASFEEATALMARATRIFSYGLGPGSTTSAFLAIHLRRVGFDARAMMSAGYRLSDDLLPLTRTDCVVLLAPYHQTTEVEVILDHARAVGASVVLISEALRLSLKDRVDVVIKTPPTISSVVSENLAPLVACYALTMQLASQQREASVSKNRLFNEIASRFTGSLDMPSPAFLFDEPETSADPS
jgi:DNA-binding MurR/RpiR family transcriptional regulator